MRCGATDVLVIGYGNDLRGDDAAGRRVADAIEALPLQGVAVRSLPQLTPELALEIAGRDLVVFVDASVDDDRVAVRTVAAGVGGGIMTHHGDPATLLAMVPAVGAPPGAAHCVSIPASRLGIGLEMSERTAAGVQEAIAAVLDLIASV